MSEIHAIAAEPAGKAAVCPWCHGNGYDEHESGDGPAQCRACCGSGRMPQVDIDEQWLDDTDALAGDVDRSGSRLNEEEA